jgi:hypothetical protein
VRKPQRVETFEAVALKLWQRNLPSKRRVVRRRRTVAADASDRPATHNTDWLEPLEDGTVVFTHCGSGSFLLGAYQYLLDYHRDWYQKDGPKKHTKEIYQGHGGQWNLTIQEKKRILLNNIYGVDIDPQAVEVTKLSLLLKVLESENQDTLERQIKLFKERALPDLGSNIKCGNSLVSSDFYSAGAGHDLPLFDKEETYRINAFDWEKEFPEVIKRGGFDAVIGNPPYGMVSSERRGSG